MNPGPKNRIFSGCYVRFVVNAADGTHPCGAATWYVDNHIAGGVWDFNKPSVIYGQPGCPSGMGGGAGTLTLYLADIAELSPGYHTLKRDYLGDSTYKPFELVGRFYVGQRSV